MSLNQHSPHSQLSSIPPGFTCVTRAEGPGVNRVTLSGELDMATAPQLADALSEVPRDCVAVVLDLTDLGFMDSTGLHTILSAQTRLAEAGCRLVVIAGCHQVQQVFELTGTDHKLEFVNAPDVVPSN
jgi:anti-anti-sigma factor